MIPKKGEGKDIWAAAVGISQDHHIQSPRTKIGRPPKTFTQISRLYMNHKYKRTTTKVQKDRCRKHPKISQFKLNVGFSSGVDGETDDASRI